MEITQPMTVADAASALDQMMLPLDGEQQKTDKARWRNKLWRKPSKHQCNPSTPQEWCKD